MIHTSNEDQNPNEIAAPPQPDIVTETQEIGAESAQKVEHLLQEAKDYSEQGQWTEALLKLDEAEQQSPRVPETVDRLRALKRKIAVWQKIQRIGDEAYVLQRFSQSEALFKYAEALRAALDPASGLQSRVREHLIDLQSRSDFHNDDVFRHAQELEASLRAELIDDRMAMSYLIPSLNQWLHLNRTNSAREVLSSLINLQRLEEAYELAMRLFLEYPTDRALLGFLGQARNGLVSRLIESVHKRLDRAQQLTTRGAVREALDALEEIDNRLVGPISLRYPEIVEGIAELDNLLRAAAELHSHLERHLPVIKEVESLAKHARESVYQGDYAAALSATHQAQRADPEHRAQLAWEQLDQVRAIAFEGEFQQRLLEAEHGLYVEELYSQTRHLESKASYFATDSQRAQELLQRMHMIARFAATLRDVQYLVAQHQFHEARVRLEEALGMRPHDPRVQEVQARLAAQWAESIIAECRSELDEPALSRDHLLILRSTIEEFLASFEAPSARTLAQLRILAQALESALVRLRIFEGYRALEIFLLEFAFAICQETTEQARKLADISLMADVQRFCEKVDEVAKRQEAAARQHQLLKFFSVAGFEVEEAWEGGVLLRPREASLRERLGPLVAVHVRLSAQLNRNLLTELVEETIAKYEQQIADRVTFVVVEQQPEYAALSLMQSYRFGERLTIVPFIASQLREALQRGTCGAELNSVINIYLGRTDLYVSAHPVSDVLSFFGRERVIDVMRSALERNANLGLFGMRKIGKTSLMQYMSAQAPYPVAWLSLQESSTPLPVFRQALQEWMRTLHLRFPDWCLPSLEFGGPDATANPAEAFAADVRTLLDTLTQLNVTPRLVLCLDEIGRIIPKGLQTEEQAREFCDLMGFLQALTTRVKSLNLVICGEQPTINRTHFWEGAGYSAQNPLFQGLQEVILGPFSREETDEMISKIGAMMGVDYDPLALEAIYKWSGGHPFLARQLCSYVTTQLHSRPVRIAAAQVLEASEQFPKEPPYLEQEMWHQLETPGQTEILRQLARHGPSSEEELIPNTLSANERWMRRRALWYLEERCLIRRNQSEFSIPYGCFREWIRREVLGA